MSTMAAGLCVILISRFLPSSPTSGWRPVALSAVRAEPDVIGALSDTEQVVIQLLDDYPASAHAVEVMARLQVRFGDPDEAGKACRRCLELDPNFALAYYWMGVLARERGELAEAATAFRQAVRLDPDSVGTASELAQVLTKTNEIGEAIDVLERSLGNDPDFVPNLMFLGEAYLQNHEPRKAREVLQRAIRFGPDCTNAYYFLSTACAKLSDPIKANEYRDRFQVLRARDSQTHRDSLKTIDDPALMRRAIAEVLAGAARVRLLHNDPQAAEALLRKACQVAPDYLESSQALVRLYERQGRTDDALRIASKLAEAVPGNLSVQVELGSLCARLKQPELAERAFRKAIELTPYRGEPYAALADLYLQTGREPSEAKVLALKAADLQRSAPFFFLLGAACRRSGDRSGALSAARRAADLDPDNVDYRRALEQLQGSQ